MKKTNRSMVGWTLLLGAALAIIAYLFIVRPVPPPLLPLTAAVTSNPDSALVLIAQHKDYFRNEGLDFSSLLYASGKDAMDAMLEGKAQLATVAETPIVLQILKGQPVKVMAGIFSSDHNMGLIARRDRGVRSVSDLRNKRIAVPLGTNAEYFLHAFLQVEGVPANTINLVDTAPEKTADALLAGSVDAVAVWQPFLYEIQQRLGEQAQVFYGEHVYTYTLNIATLPNFIEDEAPAATAFLRALLKAEQLARERPEQARAIIAEVTRWDRSVLDALWDDYSIHLSLEQALLISMEHQARWASASETPPDFLEAIAPVPLKTVAPRRVTLSP